jgi:hypothetical protein
LRIIGREARGGDGKALKFAKNVAADDLRIGSQMFEKFRRQKTIEAIAASPAGKMLDQMALAVAVAETTKEYVNARNGASILKDDEASIIETWKGARLEAISQLWGPEPSLLELIIDHTKHPKLVDAFIQRSNSYLSVKKSSKDGVDGTISAILRVYDVLAQMDFDVCSPYLQASKESPGYVGRYAGIVEEMRKLHIKWQGFMHSINTKADYMPPVPDTIFTVLWRDVTHRSKIIALCARLGPSYLSNFAKLKEVVAEQGESTARLDNLIVRVLTADDPEQWQS